jgi:excisionase family DNA binding protein
VKVITVGLADLVEALVPELERLLVDRAPPATLHLLTTDEAAERCGRAEKTVREWCRTGELVAKKTTRGWRIRPADLEQFLAGETSSAGAARSVLSRVD